MLSLLFSLLFLFFSLLFYGVWFIKSVLFLLSFYLILMNHYSFSWHSLGYLFGCDMMSYVMILLSFWIVGLMFMASESVFGSDYLINYFLRGAGGGYGLLNLFSFTLIFLLLMLYMSFISLDLFSFYFFFEGSLIPTIFLILGWGYQPDRLRAGIYLLFYTLFASLPMLLGIFFCYSMGKSLKFFFFVLDYDYLLFYLVMVVVFLVKLPMYLFHLWLPKAHVEAPVSGSMILAGVLLKLGGYGLLRLMPNMLFLMIKFNYIFIVLSLVGGFYVSLLCLRQVDLKCLIAYSSVGHMGLALGGMMTLTSWGVGGSLSMMISHGLCSSCLFCLGNMVYERVGSRSMFLNKGLINFMPSLSMWWFLMSAGNMACPPTLNLISEIALITSLISWGFFMILMISFISFFSCAYSLYLYSFTQHGKYSSFFYSYCSGVVREYLLIFLHWLPLNFLVLKLNHLFYF